jgi:hypothetical protein
MGDLSFRIIITSIDETSRDELIAEVVALLDVTEAEADDLLEDLPLTVGKGLDEDEADDLVERLSAAGAKVKIVEVESVRRQPRRRRSTAQDDEPRDEDSREDGEDASRPAAAGATTGTSKAPGANRLVIIVGCCVLAVLVGLLLTSVIGVDQLGCGGGFREPGANAELERVLPHLAKRYARGFEPQLAVAHGTLEADRSVRISEDVAGGACYAWVGLSRDGTDLDLFLRQDDNVVSSDDGEDNFPVVRHCVAQDTPLDLEVKMLTGGGDWVVQRYVLQGPPGSDLLALIQRLYASMFVVNGREIAPPKRLSLQNGQEFEVPLEMDAEWCYLPLAVSNPGTDLDMTLVDPDGREVERDDAADNYPVVRYCPTKSGTYKVKLIMFRGQGEAIYQVFRGTLAGGAKTSGGAPSPEPGL